MVPAGTTALEAGESRLCWPQAGSRQGAGRGQAEPISEAALARSHP